jgi:hypothetical protein
MCVVVVVRVGVPGVNIEAIFRRRAGRGKSGLSECSRALYTGTLVILQRRFRDGFSV